MAPDLSPQERRDAMYGEGDLGSVAIFSGSFINYGYWDGHDPGRTLSVQERTESQAELYRRVVARLDPGPGTELLELGCGRGVGAALIARETGASVHGLDRSRSQLARAVGINASELAAAGGRLSYHLGSVTDLTYRDASYDGLYSVEMLQHVDDLAAVAREAHRVLRPGGRFAAATFFAPDDAGDDAPVADLIETVADGVDVIRPVGRFASDLTAAGFTQVGVESIGEHVWRQFDHWVSQTEYRNTWGRNWLRCYDNGWIDYYLVTARR